MSASYRIAAAPISWGICDVPGWGYQLPYRQVLTEMRQLGITASEIGPAGFLPADPEEARAAFAESAITPVGTYLDLVLHDSADESWKAALTQTIAALRQLGGDTIALAALAAPHSYDGNPGLTGAQWQRLLAALDEANALAAESGITLAVHPHLGTLILTPEEIDRVLEGSSVPICLDTGHAFAGGNDVLTLLQAIGPRLGLVHLKDADAALAQALARDELGFLDAVARGIFRPLGTGDLPVRDILAQLDTAAYSGWVVLEQDIMLPTEPAPGAGPANSVRQSLDFLAKQPAR